MYSTKTVIWKDACSPVVTVAFTVAKVWKQPTCPPIDEWIKKIWYLYAVEYYSDIEKEWNFANWSNMDECGCHYAKWN